MVVAFRPQAEKGRGLEVPPGRSISLTTGRAKKGGSVKGGGQGKRVKEIRSLKPQTSSNSKSLQPVEQPAGLTRNKE